MPRRHTIAALFVLPGLLFGCRDYFDYTPYAIEPVQHHLTAANLARVSAASLPHFEPFRFAVISDTHAYYDEMKVFVNVINQRNDIAFILIAGDLTDYGLQQEFQWSVDLLAGLKQPYLTVIGNHDSLNNGKANYRAFFGEFDYSFTFNQVKIVALNSASWEFDNTVPRLDWLGAELSSYHLYQHQLVLTHMLPQNERFPADFSAAFLATVKDNFVSLVVGGHGHAHAYAEEILSNGLPIGYLTTGTLKDRGYVLVTVEAGSVTIERQVF